MFPLQLNVGVFHRAVVIVWAVVTYLATELDLRCTFLQTVVDLHHGCVGQGWLQPVNNYLACRFDGSLR